MLSVSVSSGIPYFFANPGVASVVNNEPEQVFIELAKLLFNPWIAGILLSAILAAVMSTLSAQLLISSSSITEDFIKVLFVQKRQKRVSMVRPCDGFSYCCYRHLDCSR